MAFWLSGSDRVRIASQLVTEFGKQYSVGQYKTVLRQFDIDSTRKPEYLLHLLLEDTDDNHIAALGRHFGVAVPEQPEPEPVEEPPLDANDIDAYAELVSAETALRDVIRLAVPNWIDDLTPEEVMRLEEKRAEEDKRRDGIAVSQDLLDYTEVYQVEKTINKHWDPAVRAILSDKKRSDVYLSIMGDIRNSIAHTRPVFPAERLLLAGAAGQIRNQLARYKALADGPQRHYPSLDSARDSMGTVAPSNPELLRKRKTESSTTPRLEVGDTVTFELEATDPRGRELVWTAYSVPGHDPLSLLSQGYYPVIAETTGSRTSFTWKVSETDVGEGRSIAITVANAGQFHRHEKYDDACAFEYHVNPPPDA